MTFSKFSAVFSLFLTALSAAVLVSMTPLSAQEAETWYRQPAVSPDGQTIVFSAHGDLWSVPSAGGTAIALTRDDAWEGHAVWSRDGSRIAFASDRFGDFDVFVMDADGGNLTRLTFHDSADVPSDFSPDGSRVLFSSPRMDSAASSYYPTRALPELYEISVEGGAPSMLFTNPAREARWSPDGTQIVYREEKAYENEWRQRDVSAFARDIWVYDVAAGTHQKITDNPAGDHAPVWSADGTQIYMQSEIDGGSFNVHRLDLATGASEALTSHGPYAARNLSRSDEGLMTYAYHGDLYTLRDGEEPQALAIRLSAMSLTDAPQPVAAASAITEFAVSPDGSEIVFVSRGEVFVTDAQFADTVRITNTPQQERSVSFSPDGRSVLYAGEREHGWAIYETTMSDANEPRFSAATDFAERLVYVAEGTDAFQPQYSPDGEKIAFLRTRDAVWVVDRDGTSARVVFPADVNYSYSDGDISFDWSPDSQWITADYAARGYYFYTDIGIAPADGSAPPRDISLNGYWDAIPAWHSSGEVMMWRSDRYGDRTHGSWGSEDDIIAAFLTESAWDRFNLTDQERALLEEHAANDNEEEAEGEDEEATIDILAFLNISEPRGEDDPIEIDFDGIEDRTARLTLHSSDLADAALTNDLSALYYLAAFEGGYDLWRHDLAAGETSKVASMSASEASFEIVGDDSKIVVLADGQLMQGDLGESITLSPVQVGGEVTVHADAERAYLFDHVWRQVNDKFYDPAFHGIDWPAMRDGYGSRVAGVSHNRDFANLVAEMLGHLNASHTGMYYRHSGGPSDDSTGALGAIFDLDGTPGLGISEILDGGPLDRETFGLSAGDRIIAIGGTALEGNVNPFELLNRRAGDRIRLTIAATGRRSPERTIRVRAYSRSEENTALYERWIERRREIVETRSNGRLGYLHIRSMSDTGFRQAYTEIFGRNFDKEALVIDTRFNGGGWLHDELITLLSGEPYFGIRVRGRTMRGAPEERWARPSVVVMNEGNYSNAHMFPYAYDLFDLGSLVGMPVPGTGTAVWWETLMTGDVYFGIPQVGVLDQEGQPLENQQLEPDVLVDNPPEAAAAGDDRPLEAAVDALIADLDAE